jgi:hypothetical protein
MKLSETRSEIELIHPVLRNYRVELFDELNRQYSVKFIFTMHQERTEFGGTCIPKSWKYGNINVKGSVVMRARRLAPKHLSRGLRAG